MIVVINPGVEKAKIDKLEKSIIDMGLAVDRSEGENLTILGLVGDTSIINEDAICMNPIVNKIMHVQAPYKKANRMFHPENSIIDVSGTKIGGNQIAVIAGPCSVESEEQIVSIARKIKASGAQFLRGGAFKPRSSPYSFRGLGVEGLRLLNIAKKETGLKIVSEILNTDMIDEFIENVDMIQVGARNMQNFILLTELGKTDKPILLKRGMSATMEEWLMSAEYIISEGNSNVVLCERGIRTFENYTRNTLDISAIPVIKAKSHLPIIVDPSHAGGEWWLVEPLSKAAISAGADGLMIEVHENPEKAFSDGAQSLKPKKFDRLMKKIEVLSNIEGRSIYEK